MMKKPLSQTTGNGKHNMARAIHLPFDFDELKMTLLNSRVLTKYRRFDLTLIKMSISSGIIRLQKETKKILERKELENFIAVPD